MRRWCVLAALLLVQAASATELAELAKREAGKADKALRDEDKAQGKDEKVALPEIGSGANGESAQRRMERLFEEAHAAAPNKWYQAAKVEDITPPGDDARKIYKITGVLGTYCARYADKNRGDQGKANLGEALIGACPHMFKGM